MAIRSSKLIDALRRNWLLDLLVRSALCKVVRHIWDYILDR